MMVETVIRSDRYLLEGATTLNDFVPSCAPQPTLRYGRLAARALPAATDMLSRRLAARQQVLSAGFVSPGLQVTAKATSGAKQMPTWLPDGALAKV
jgi:hypothetical protein